MKYFKILLKAIGLLFLLLIILFVGVVIYQSIDKVDAFYLKNANFSDYEYLNKNFSFTTEEEYAEPGEELSVYVHRLALGEGVVIAYRWYSIGGLGLDDELFEKLTIWTPALPEKYPVELKLSDAKSIKAVYTVGGSAWPRHACSHYIKSGTLTINKDGSSLKVSIESIISPADTKPHNNSCDAKKALNIQFSSHEIKFSELTPWLGLKGKNPQEETFR